MLQLLRRVRDWPVDSQQQARRNAMVAATAAAQRRVERQEVEDFLTDVTASGRPAPGVGRAVRR